GPVLKFVESGISYRPCQFCSTSLPQVPAAFHELQFGCVAANFQEGFKFIYGQPEAPLKLFIYSVVAEHCPAPRLQHNSWDCTAKLARQRSKAMGQRHTGRKCRNRHEFERLARGPKLHAIAR